MSTSWGGPRTALAAILAGAAALRAVGIEYGLPFGLLDPDEQNIVPRAWRVVHGGGLDPHWFDYPSLLLYVAAPFQAWQSSPSYLAGRAVVVALGLAAIAASWWLGRRSYGVVAAAVAAAIVAVDTVHVAYSRVTVTDVPLTLGVAVALTLMVSGRLELAGVAAGLATGFKYPGVLLLVPLAVAAWGQWRRLAIAVALALLAFAATNPFFFAHFDQAMGDAYRVQRLAREGWLGFEHDHGAPIAFVDRLWESLGPVLIVAALGLLVALVRRRGPDLVLASFVLVYFADLLTLNAHFDRYVLPLLPPLGVLAGRFRALAPVALLLLVVPLTWAIRDDRRLTRTDTRVVARSWIERHVPRGANVAVESSLPPLAGFKVLPLALPGPSRRSDPNRDVGRLRKHGIGFAVVSGAVADRVLAARERYRRETRFYLQLRRSARRVYYVKANHALTGPWVAVYRL